MSRQSIAIAALLVFVAGSVRAEDAKPVASPPADKSAEPAGMSSPAPTPPAVAAPAAKPAPRPTPEQAADAVLASIKSKDSAALKALAANDETDPWLVADELMRRGEFDAADAFAKASPRPDVEALPRYVEAGRLRASDDAERDLLTAMLGGIASGDFAKVLKGTEALATEADTVVRVRLLHVRGDAFWHLEHWHECAAVSRSAADAAIALGWLFRAWKNYDRAILSAQSASEGPQTLACLDARLRLSERRGDAPDAARAQCQIGSIQMMLGDPSLAGPAFDLALARYEALKDDRGIAWVLSRAAELYKTLGDRGKEIAARERVQPLWDALGMRDIAANNVFYTACAYRDVEDHARAIAKFQDALARLPALGGDKVAKGDIAACLIDIGNAYAALGDRTNAMTYLERGRALAEEIGHRPWLRNAMVGIGMAYRESGEHAKALATFQQLLTLHEQWGDKAGAADCVKAIGDVYFARGDCAKAVATYEQALQRMQALGSRVGEATILQQMGQAYLALGDYARSFSVQEQALALFEALGDKGGQAGVLINLGITYISIGDSASSLAHYQRGLALAEEAGHRRWALNALTNIANAQRGSGETARALATYERALKEYEALRDSVGAVKALENMGKAYASQNDHAKALEFYLKALERSEATGDNAMIAYGCIDIGCAYDSLGDLAKARAFLERGERVARSHRLTPLRVSALRELVVFHRDHGETALALHRAREALGEMENLLGNLGEEQGATARSGHATLFAMGTVAAVRENDLAAAFTFLESGRAGALLDDLDKREALRWKAESLSPELQRLDADAQAKERAARDAYEQASRSGDLKAERAATAALDDASQGVRDVTGRIQRELKLQAQFFYPRAKAIEETRSALQADQALVLYGLCEDETFALVVRHDGERAVALGKVADVVAACDSLDAKDPGVDPMPALDALRKRLVEPLALEEDVKQVLVSPEGPLCYLPFAALFRQTVAMTPSGTTHLLLLDEQAAPGRGILALGDPDYGVASAGARAIYQRGGRLTPLPATRAEVTSIGTRTLLGVEASEARFLEVLPSSPRWRAIHFACHGLVNIDKPMLSSLALTRAGDADGFFTALEVLRTKIPADLVVLSACETATGKIVNGEGIVGLTRAFMFAGAPRVICSLWKVDDEATRALMVKFYELWNPKDGKPGLGTAEALRKAQEFIRSQEKWKHPYFWAAWVLWGLPS